VFVKSEMMAPSSLMIMLHIFFDNVDRITEPSYLPSEDDILRSRVRTTGIEESEFQINDFRFKMIDVGGQRTERRKWIHCFGDDSSLITAIIYCASLSEYDQQLREDSAVNRLQESLLLFDEVCNSAWFAKTPFILFLNKVDLFKEKIKTVDLKSFGFDSYTGGRNFENASVFIKARYLELNKSPHPIYTHFTCAISTENVQFVFNVVRETILQKLLKKVFVL